MIAQTLPSNIADLDSPTTTLQHRRMLLGKPFLKKLYTEWYRAFLAAVPDDRPGAVLEIGSGGGFLKELCPQVITSDIQPLPHCDMAFPAGDIPLDDESVRAIGMINVLHHIPDVAAFFSEAERVLVPGGVLFMIEPANTPLSRFIYTHIHHEPFLPDARDWHFSSTGPLSGANGALPWIVFTRDAADFARRFPRLSLQQLRPHTPLRYLASGGFSFRAGVPGFWFAPLTFFERLLTPLFPCCALFQTIVVKKLGESQECPDDRTR